MQINKITKIFDFGKALKEPEEIKGGLLHKMYCVSTEKGLFAVKVLNREIMKRPEALKNMMQSEKIAAAFGGSLPVVAALTACEKQLHEIDGDYYMVFPWVEGQSVFPPDISKQHCEAIGDILGRMHRLDISVDGVEAEEEAEPIYEWERYLQMAKEGKEKPWVAQYERSLPDIYAWNQAVCDVQKALRENRVISHRDLDPKNVLWNGLQPLLIDWEAAGYVNPYQELLEVVNYWADDGNGSLCKTYFDGIVKAYKKHVSLAGVDWEQVLAGGCAGMLGWLEYNVKRALGLEASDAEEVRLGEEQIKGTIRELYAYQAKAELLKDWFGQVA